MENRQKSIKIPDIASIVFVDNYSLHWIFII